MEIQKGIPLPKKMNDIWREMKVGDSVFVKTLSRARSSWAFGVTQAPLRKYSIRGEKSGYRVWRIK
jgi:hypothetical protein